MKRLLFFAAIGLLALFWWHSMWARETARQAARRECQRFGLTLIDDTVERVKIGLGRSQTGGTTFVRVYRFEFSPTGERRYRGHITMRGRVVETVQMEPYSVE